MSKESFKFNRREFLKMAGLTAAGFLLSSCRPENRPENPTPTKKPPEKPQPTNTPPKPTEPTIIPTATKEPTATPEPTPTIEVVKVAGIPITPNYLKQAFAGIGGGEETGWITFGRDYVSQSWGKEIDFQTLSQNPVSSLEWMISLGAYQGAEGIFYPGKEKGEVVFPQVENLAFARLTLQNVPSELEQKKQEYQEGIAPLNILLRPETQMTVVGLLEKTPPPQEVTVIDKETIGGKLRYVLVAFTDYLRVSENGIPRHYFAIIPDNFPADPENKNTLSLKNILEKNGYQYALQTKEILMVDPATKKETKLGLNQIQGLTDPLTREAGLLFVDKLNEEAKELIFNPIVPYPEQMPAVWEIEQKKDDQENAIFLLKGQQVNGEFKDLMVARYDKQKEQWVWEGIPEIPKEEVMQIEGLETKWNPQTKRWEYYDSKDGLVAGWWNSEQKRFELNSQLTVLRARWKGLYQKVEKDQKIEEGKIPIPFDLGACGEGEIKLFTYILAQQECRCLSLVGIPVGTKIYAPLEGKLRFEESKIAKHPESPFLTVDIEQGDNLFSLETQYLGKDQRGFLENEAEVQVGNQIGLIVSDKPFYPEQVDESQCLLFLFPHYSVDDPINITKLDFFGLAQTSQGKFLTF